MKSPVLSALAVVFAVGSFSACSGSENQPAVSSGPTAAATDDQRTPQSDTLTGAETALVNQANAEPVPAAKPDL